MSFLFAHFAVRVLGLKLDTANDVHTYDALFVRHRLCVLEDEIVGNVRGILANRINFERALYAYMLANFLKIKHILF